MRGASVAGERAWAEGGWGAGASVAVGWEAQGGGEKVGACNKRLPQALSNDGRSCRGSLGTGGYPLAGTCCL